MLAHHVRQVQARMMPHHARSVPQAGLWPAEHPKRLGTIHQQLHRKCRAQRVPQPPGRLDRWTHAGC
eukprot:scaffold13303_cov70-Phaeocystis_antarctica.AAC.7